MDFYILKYKIIDVPHDIGLCVRSKVFRIDEVKTGSGKTFRLVCIPFYYVGVLDRLMAAPL